MKYDIKFKLYTKNLRCTIEADSKAQAEYLLRGKIEIISIKEVKGGRMTNTPDIFNEIFGGE